jgi:predicted nucleic acid-binding protein
MADSVVADASVIVDVLINGRVLPSTAAHASPVHMDAEVLSALGRLHRHGVLTADDVEEMLDDLAALPVQRVPIIALTSVAFALRHNVALRDGLYVALAQASGAALVTADQRLARVCADQGLCSLV